MSNDKEKTKTERLNLLLEPEIFDYIKTVGAARKGSMTKYIEYLVKQDREAWKDNEAELRDILSR